MNYNCSIRWDQNLASWSLMGDAEEYRMNEDRHKVIQALRESGPMSARQVSEAMGGDYNATRQRLYQMAMDGLLNNHNGVHYLPNNPNSPNNPNNDSKERQTVREETETVRGDFGDPNNSQPRITDTCAENGEPVRDVRTVRVAHEDEENPVEEEG